MNFVEINVTFVDSALNYGAMGLVIGHEFGHALDAEGKDLQKNNLIAILFSCIFFIFILNLLF